jgi:hypothetical protein
MELCLACRSKVFESKPTGDAGVRNNGRLGEKGRLVLNVVRAAKLAPIVSFDELFSIEIVTPSPGE